MHLRNTALVVVGSIMLFVFNGYNPYIALFAFIAFIREAGFNEAIPDLEIPKLSSKQDHPSSSSKPPASPPRRICVVTGGAGHFGKILISELLSKGKYDVIRAYDVVKPNYPDARVESSKGSILDSSGLYRVFEGAETVFHVASLVDLREEAHHQHQLRLVNVLGCQNVVNACVRRAVKKLVYTSSANACIEGKPVVLDERVAEKVLLKNLISTYGRTKLEAERLVLAANNHCNLKTIALRPFMVYGEGDKNFTDRVASGFAILTENSFNVVYSRNLAHWHHLADLSLDEKPEITSGKGYFVADQQEDITKAQITQIVLEAVKPAKLWSFDNRILFALSAFLPWIDWFTCGRFKSEIFQLNAATMFHSYEDCRIDPSEGIRDLGYVRPYSSEMIKEILGDHYNKKKN